VTTRNRVDVIHGVNLDMLGRRPAQHYGDLTFDQLEVRIGEYARELNLEARFFQTNHEGELIEHLHRLEGLADAVVINPGAWTHYAWSIRDALEITGLPAVEVHLSDVDAREDFRKVSVIRDLCFLTVKGQGVEGYRAALAAIKEKLDL
jgi:3-dehydroquinate dehydratase-2